MRSLLYTIAAALLLVAGGCKKVEFDNEAKGEAVESGTFRLLSPASGDSVRLNAATPDSRVVIQWTSARPGVNSEIRYNWVAVRKTPTAPDFAAANRVATIPADNGGKDTKLSLTQKQIDDLLKGLNIAAGQRVELAWTIEADNGNSKVLAPGSSNIILYRMSDGATPFSILGPTSTETVTTINPNVTADSIRFNWTRSMPATAAAGLRYRVYFFGTGNDATPLFSIASRSNGTDSVAAISYKDFSDSLTKYGFANMATTANLNWRVAATSGSWTQWSDFANRLNIAREVKLYMVGGSTAAGWTPSAALRMIEDEGRAGVFYTYAYLNAAGGGFKFLGENTDWSTPTQKIYGDTEGSGTSGNLVLSGGSSNINVPSGDGVYRITVDLSNNKYYVQKTYGRMGIVGGGTTAGWNPGAVYPAQEMGFLGTNLFLGITNVTSGGEFKLLDNNAWPNGEATGTRDYEDAGNNAVKENGGPNFKWDGATGPVRVIWDYRDVKAPKAMVSSAAEMRIVGDGMAGVNAWDPANSPQMTYKGNGQWEATLNLVGGKDIKFLAGNAWGALDYEDAGNGKIKWEGGDNFKTPAASGTYTIVLDEYKGTITIRQ